jgi:histidyl-tRNA synthetase
VKYQPVRGMRDIVGKNAIVQQRVEDAVRCSAEKYGYLPLYTPAVESFELFTAKGTAGEAIKNEIYYFKDKSERELGLRFEFTASLARVAASSQLKLPFKRFQIGEVYRYDRPQAKRYRAFTQADIDILGVKGLEAELELMLIAKDVLSKLNIDAKIKFNNRKLLQSILEGFAKGKEIEAMRIIDKLDKFSEDDVKRELKEKGINPQIIDVVKKNSLDEISRLESVKYSDGLKEVNDFSEMLQGNELDFVELDLSLARGLEYYTGTVFEIKADNGPSIGGGGRFDRLIESYGGQTTPAVGISFGVSRIFDFLVEKNDKIALEGLFLFGLGIPYGKVISVAETFRNNGINTEQDLTGKNISKNLDYAQSKGYKYAGIIGENELKTNSITIKDIETGEQKILPISKAISFIKEGEKKNPFIEGLKKFRK